MPPAERGLQGWTCVYGRALAGRARDPVQNNGATVECSTAGNILSQTQKAFLGSEEEHFYKLLFMLFNATTQSHVLQLRG